MHLLGGIGNMFSRSIGFPIVVNGNWRRAKSRERFKSLYAEKLEMQRWPRERLEAHRLERMRRLLHHAGTRVPYYRDLFSAIRFDPLRVRSCADVEALPLLTKDMIREQADRLTADDASRRDSFRNSSGGSTGNPLDFIQDAEFRDHIEAAVWVSDGTAGRRFGSRTALLWGSTRDVDLAAGLKGLAYGVLRNEWFFNSFDMSESQMHRFHVSMQRTPPDVLVAYASSAYLFAAFLEANGLRPDYPRISIITSAEVLRDDMRGAITRTFGRPVYDRYGSREVGLIAFECEAHRGLHMNTADLYVECLGENVCEQAGELIITQLNNYSMPLIRYRIEDMAVLRADPCTCSRQTPMIQQVIGRTTDTIQTRSGDLIHGEYFTHLFYGLKGIAKFQLVQESLDEFKLFIVRGADFDPKVIEVVRRETLKVVGEGCSLTVDEVADIPPARSGKFLFTISKVPITFDKRPLAAAGAPR
jgi:phenylacetate-CoA ligase